MSLNVSILIILFLALLCYCFILSTCLTGELFRRGCVFVLGKGWRFYMGQTHNFQYFSQILREFTRLKWPEIKPLLEFWKIQDHHESKSGTKCLSHEILM